MDDLNLEQFETNMNELGYCCMPDAKRLVECVRNYREVLAATLPPAAPVEAPAEPAPAEPVTLPATDANGAPAA